MGKVQAASAGHQQLAADRRHPVVDTDLDARARQVPRPPSGRLGRRRLLRLFGSSTCVTSEWPCCHQQAQADVQRTEWPKPADAERYSGRSNTRHVVDAVAQSRPLAFRTLPSATADRRPPCTIRPSADSSPDSSVTART